MKGYIYEINIGDKKYIGSTKMTYLANRQSAHNRDLKKNIKQNPLFEECRKQNITKIVCELIEVVEVEDKKQLRTIEQSYIDNLKPELNLSRALRTKEDERLDSNKRGRKYYNRNKEKMNTIINCDCGGTYVKRNITRHLETKKHLEFISNK